MKRPKPQISKPNHHDDLIHHLHSQLPYFTSLNGIVGVSLNGGLARGYGDHLSEIDITLFLDDATYPLWQQGESAIGIGIQVINGALYDIKYISLEIEPVQSWSADMRWDASYAKLLYDPTHIIATALAENNKFKPRVKEASSLMFEAWWYFDLACNIWLHREDYLQANLMLNQAVNTLLKALFVVNQEFIPHIKWLVHMTYTLNWKPDNWFSHLKQVIHIPALNSASTQQRQQNIRALWQSINDYAMSQIESDILLMQLSFYDLMQLLVQHTTVSKEEWLSHVPLDLVNQAPFNLCVQISDNQIILQQDKLLSISPNQLYIWHYEIIEVIQKQLSGDI